ncbi:hypothetical protein MP638_000979 [Amoeboaphelidium occidentale]|nr:hypothetical protein MP638_000979 [Amoeboaphelidium occidentale]
MVSFVCDKCQETVKKPKLDAHRMRCRNTCFSCVDCSVDFYNCDYRQHTSCITEVEKYQGKSKQTKQQQQQQQQQQMKQQQQQQQPQQQKKVLEVVKDSPLVKVLKTEETKSSSLRSVLKKAFKGQKTKDVLKKLMVQLVEEGDGKKKQIVIIDC